MLATLTFPESGDLRAARCQDTLQVRSADDLRRALRTARERALALDLSALNRMLRLDGERGQIEVQAATLWSSVEHYLGERGAPIAPGALASGLPVSVGEAVAENAAGPDGTPMVAQVEAITLVTPDGELRRADRQMNPHLFRLAIGGHGLFGVLYSVTLRVESMLLAAERVQAPVELDLSPAAGAAGVGRMAEFLVPPEQLERVLAGFKELAAERRIPLQKVTVRRLLPEHDTVLCWATRDWAGVTLRYWTRPTLGASVHAAEIQRLLLDTVLAHGGSFPIVVAHLATPAQLAACYPKLGEFVEEKRRYDPAERLQNAWYRRVAASLRGDAFSSPANE